MFSLLVDDIYVFLHGKSAAFNKPFGISQISQDAPNKNGDRGTDLYSIIHYYI